MEPDYLLPFVKSPPAVCILRMTMSVLSLTHSFFQSVFIILSFTIKIMIFLCYTTYAFYILYRTKLCFGVQTTSRTLLNLLQPSVISSPFGTNIFVSTSTAPPSACHTNSVRSAVL